MNEAYLPKGTGDKIARVLEETAEVIQEIGKIQRFGLDTRYNHEAHKVQNNNAAVESNREALVRELKDLQHAAHMLQEHLKTAPLDYTNPFDAPKLAEIREGARQAIIHQFDLLRSGERMTPATHDNLLEFLKLL